MNKETFMNRLRELLSDITEAEREEALSYYEDYFNDAGEENEEEVIASLGTPETVAATIKQGLNGADNSGEYSETGYQSGDFYSRDEVASRNLTDEERGFRKKQQMTGSMIVLLVILGIFAIPILVPALFAVFGVVFGLLCAAIGILLAVLAAGIGLAIGGFATLISGFFALFVQPLVGVIIIGIGLVLTGVGFLLSVLGTWILMKAVPPLVRGFVDLCRRPFRKNR